MTGLGPGKGRRLRRTIGSLVIVVGLLVLTVPLLTNVWTAAAQESMARGWVGEAPSNDGIESGLVASSVEVGGAPPTLSNSKRRVGAKKGAIARLVIPRMGLDAFVVEGVGQRALRRGPGHMPGTPLPGQAGNSVISGHRVTFGRPFYRLDEMRAGDPILVETPKGRFEYRVVRSEVVKPREVRVIKPTPEPTLTLTTCHPRFSASRRLVVTARLVSPQNPAAAEVKRAALTGGR